MQLFDRLLYEELGQGQILSTDLVRIPGLEDARPLTLYLPPDYHRGERNYPIAYLFDGQNLYDREAWPAGWQLHRILDERAAEGIEVPIVVGIHHGNMRDEELCPWPAEKGQTPRGDALLDWMVHDLHPQLCAQLRVDDRPEKRLIGGSSLGGLLALYAGFRHHDFFAQVMAMSPSLWVGQGAIYDYIAEAAFLANLDSLKLYIDCGALEADEETEAWGEDRFEEEEEEEEWDTDPLEDAEYLIEILEAKGFIGGEHFLWVPDPEGTHDEWHWSKRLPLALSWLYQDAVH